MSLHAHPSDGLSAYLDGDLEAHEARAVADHLAACAECRAVVADLERLRAEARAWANDVASPPAADLWPGIAARLSPSEAQAGVTGTSSRAPVAHISWYRRRVSLGLAELALAASLVAALGGALIYQRASAPAAPAGPAPIVAQVEPFDAPSAGVVTVSFADAHYDAAVGDLERVRDARGRPLLAQP